MKNTQKKKISRSYHLLTKIESGRCRHVTVAIDITVMYVKVKNALRYFFFRPQSQITVWALKRMHAYLIRGQGIHLQRFIQYCLQSLGSFRRIPHSGKFCQVSWLVCNRKPVIMASLARNVYLLKIGAESFGDGSQDICKDTENNLGPLILLTSKVENLIIQKQD